MVNTVGKHISIKEYQAKYLDENHINLSSLVQEKIDEEIPDQVLDNKSTEGDTK